MNKDEKFGRAEAPGRSEDARLLTVKGRFTADLDFPDMVHAVFVRSPYGHADIKNIDLAEAAAALGVVGVFTADDFPNIHSIPCARVILGRDGRELVRPDRYPLAKGRVRHVGECVAVVIAETKALAEDAADLVMIDYAPLEAVARPERAIKDSAPQLWPEAPNNILLDWDTGDKDAVDVAFKKAKYRVRLDTRNNRLMVSALEPRAAIGRLEAGRLTLYACSQGVMTMHTQLSKHALKLDDPSNCLLYTSPSPRDRG